MEVRSNHNPGQIPEPRRTGPVLPSPIRTRFAPSPTGHLHEGHLAHIVYLFGLAFFLEAQIDFRMEDHDRERCRTHFADSIQEDLVWLGLARESTGWIFQSRREALYRTHLQKLQKMERIYRCGCSRRMIRERAEKSIEPPMPGREIPYDGFCRNRICSSPEDCLNSPGESLRLRLEEHPVDFVEISRFNNRQGENDSFPATGDPVIRDNKGNWSYQFCVSVDDLDRKVNLVIRGEDLLSSTERQVQMAKLLGRKSPPFYFHHPVLRDASGRKLSKSAGDGKGLRNLGLSREQLLGEGACRAGLLASPQEIRIGELGELFRHRPEGRILREAFFGCAQNPQKPPKNLLL